MVADALARAAVKGLDPLGPVLAVAAFAFALASAGLLVRLFGEAPAAGRYSSIDGLRGLLAFSVFLFHSACWYFFLRTGKWGGLPSHLYTHFGGSAVALFFMITAFLFGTKVLDSRERPIDWQRLYVGRVMRLTPLYLFAMLLLFALVAIESHAALREPLRDLLRNVAIWLGFAIFGEPDLNGVADTTQLLAGVTWSLPYEWFFYLLLPLLALLAGGRPPLRWVTAGIAVAIVIALGLSNRIAYLSFLGGIVAAFAARSPMLRARLSGNTGGIAACICMATAVLLFPSAYSRPTLPLLTIAFVIVACGNTLFGLLISGAARKLGQMAYSLYLLHGAFLFTIVHYLIGVDTARAFTPAQHGLTILLCTPVLVLLCALSYRLIEAPGVNATPRLSAWLKQPRALRAVA